MTYLNEKGRYDYDDATGQYVMPHDFGYYYFAVTEEEIYKSTIVTFCPSEYFDSEGYLWDQHTPMESRLPRGFIQAMEAVYEFDGSPELAELTCETLGFRRNEAFEDFIKAYSE